MDGDLSDLNALAAQTQARNDQQKVEHALADHDNRLRAVEGWQAGFSAKDGLKNNGNEVMLDKPAAAAQAPKSDTIDLTVIFNGGPARVRFKAEFI